MESSRKLTPSKFEAGVFEKLRQQLPHNASVCVAVSGGLDSMVLLHLFSRFAQAHPLRLSAIHINHQLQAESRHWQALVKAECRRHSIPLTITRVQVPLDQGLGLEAAAREARYRAFGALHVQSLALAHHQDDQAETLWIQLLRGAGVQGLAGMPAARPHQSLQLIRPLLSYTRQELEAYAKGHQIPFVEDPSNQDQRLVRNFLRHRLGPLLEERFPAWRHTVARSAELLGEAAQVLEQVALLDLAECRKPDGIEAAQALALGDARAANLLRHWFSQEGVRPPASARLREWLRQAQAAPHRQPELCWEGWRLYRYRGLWQLQPQGQAWTVVALADFPVAADYRLPDGGCLRVAATHQVGLRRDLPPGPWQLRCRVGGERLRPRPGGPSRTLKNLLVEAQIPAWQRQQWPLLFLGERLVAVPGVAVDAEFQSPQGGFSLNWLPPAHTG
jgi:tRNA(Ile)-lysidine synthase